MDQQPVASAPMTEADPAGTRSMRSFLVVWAGQLVSITGTYLTGFGLQVWVYLETGSVFRLAMVTLAYALPGVLLSPIAGVIVDRMDRRVAMIISDTIAGFTTLVVAVLYFTGTLEIWHIYALSGFSSIGNTLQAPAWMAAIPLLVPKKHLGRANGLVMTNDAVALVAGPALAGILLTTVGLGAVLIVDGVTFAFAVLTLMFVRFPAPPSGEHAATGAMLEDMRAGWGYLRRYSGLLWLLFIYAGVNFVLAFTNVLLIPLVLSFASEASVGGVLSAAGVGMLVASLAVSAWGGPKSDRIKVVMWGIASMGLFVVLSGLRPSLLVIAAGSVLLMLELPIINTASQVIWQLKVPLEMQGRVFSLRRVFSQAASPIAILLVGPLADNVFEPLLAEGGRLYHSVGSIIGTGPGRGIALMFIIAGLGTSLMGVIGWLHPRVRNLETEIPDYVVEEETGDQPAADGPEPESSIQNPDPDGGPEATQQAVPRR